MTFKTFLSEALILEGGSAIKGSHPLTQAEAREISMHAIRDLKALLKLESTQIAVVGSAGLKAPDQLSGDIDIAVVADVAAVKRAVEQLALDGRFKHMPGLNVFSYAKLHGNKVAQVDVIPTTSIKLAKWAYHNDPADLKLGLKGSHRNELLFAIAKYAEYVSTAKDQDGKDSARIRLVFDLSRGLYRFTQDRAGKRGLKKSFSTVTKQLVTSDPDEICARLFGDGVTAKQVLTFDDALKLMLSSSFKHKGKLKEIIERAITGLEQKKLVVPHELRTVSLKESQIPTSLRTKVLELQQFAIEHGFDYELSMMSAVQLNRHNRRLKLWLGLGYHVSQMTFDEKHAAKSGYLLSLSDELVDKITRHYEANAHREWVDRELINNDYDDRENKFRWDSDPWPLAPEEKEFPLKNVPTAITIGDNGSSIMWCLNDGFHVAKTIDKLDRAYITKNEHLTEEDDDEA